MTDTCYECDHCQKPLDLNWAICVTNSTTHLHADTDECVTALERELGTVKSKPKAVVPFPGAAATKKNK